MTQQPLTPDQVANWREVLSEKFGPYAMLMPVEEIQKIHDAMQAKINKGKRDSCST